MSSLISGDVSRETSVKLCACGCGEQRDRPGQRYRRACAARYMRQWRRRRKLAPDSVRLIVESLQRTARYYRGATDVLGGERHAPGECSTCDRHRELAATADELAAAIAKAGKLPL